MFCGNIFNCPYCGELISNRVSCKICATKLEDLINFKKIKTRYCDEITAPFFYEGLVREAILNYKFRGMVDNCESFAFFMKNCDFAKADLVVGVPCFKNRKKFKIIKNLVLVFSRSVRLNCSFSALRKIKQTRLQHECDLNQRLVNLNGAFKALRRRVSGRAILICDDIVTSGSTVNEIAKVLKEAGAVRVGAVAIAISKTYFKNFNCWTSRI